MFLFWRHNKTTAPTTQTKTPRTTADLEVRAWTEQSVLHPTALRKIEDGLTGYQVDPRLTEEEALIASVAIKDTRGNGASVHLASMAALLIAAGSLFATVAYDDPASLTHFAVLAVLIVTVTVVGVVGTHAVYCAGHSAGVRAVIEHRRDRATLRRLPARRLARTRG